MIVLFSLSEKGARLDFRRRAVSLIELIFALFLVGLMMTLGLVNLKGRVTAADSHALALSAAETLRVARQTAMTTQQPVAVMLPTTNGSTPLAQSLYLATGLSMAHVSSVNSFQGNNSQAFLFEGVWTPAPGGNLTIYPTLPDQRYAGSHNPFPFPAWLTNPNLGGYPIATDYALIFQPDGTVSSNGLPFYQNGSYAGAYCIIAAEGATVQPAKAPAVGVASPAGAAALNYFQLLAVGQPWAVSVTPSGEIAVTSGLPGADPSAVQILSSAIPAAGPAPGIPPRISVLPPSHPTVNLPSQFVLLPTVTNTSGLPAGMNTTLAPDKRITLVVNATDSSGRDIFCNWTASPAHANSSGTIPPNGSFAYSGPEKMDWDNINQIWTASWDWQCPTSASQGDVWTFTCSFGDGPAAMVPYGPLSQQLMAAIQGRLWVVATDSSGGRLWKSNLDGTDAKTANQSLAWNGVSQMTVSSDGQVISYVTTQSLSDATINGTNFNQQDYNAGLLAGTTGQLMRSNTIDLRGVLAGTPVLGGGYFPSPRADKAIFWHPMMSSLGYLYNSTVFPSLYLTNQTNTNFSGYNFGPPWVAMDVGAQPSAFMPPNSMLPGQAGELVWSSDETKIAVQNQGKLYVLSTAGPFPQASAAIDSGVTTTVWDVNSRYLFYAKAGELYQWDSTSPGVTPSIPYTSTGGAIGASRFLAQAPDGSRFYFLNTDGNLAWIGNAAGAGPITEIPFPVPGSSITNLCISK